MQNLSFVRLPVAMHHHCDAPFSPCVCQIPVLGLGTSGLATSHTITAMDPNHGPAHYLWDGKGKSGQVSTLLNQLSK